jgi:xylulokinase
VPRRPRDAIAALSFAVSGNEATPMDESGRALAPTVMAMDARGTDVVTWWERTLGRQRIYDISGIPVHPMHPLVRLMWLRDERPDVFERTARFLCWGELLAERLGADPAIDHSMASCSMAFDLRQREYSQELLASAGIARDLFPRAVPTGTPIGTVSRRMANELDIGDDVLVVAGGFDQPMAALGAGQVLPGHAGISSGSWEALLVVIGRPLPAGRALESGYVSGCYVTDGSYYTVANNAGGGSVLRWFRDTLGGEEIRAATESGADAYDLLLSQAAPGPTGLLVAPHFAGSYNPWMDPHATGVVLGLTLATTRAELITGVLEGITYELRENLERMEACGVEIGELVATGGGARSPFWLQLRADVTGHPLHTVSVEETGCFAAACVAGAGAGVFDSIEQPLEEFVRPLSTYEPNAARKARYDEIFDHYRQLYPAVRGIHPHHRTEDDERPATGHEGS